MELQKPQDLFALSAGDLVSKRNLFDLIQYSKVESSPYWGGSDAVIGNTPQQGINWIGPPLQVTAVIIKTRPGAYAEDGWSDESRTAFRYSFKARKHGIAYTEVANDVLIKQPQRLYPIFLFTEHAAGWHFEGAFFVSDIEERYVVLHRGKIAASAFWGMQDEILYREGQKKYVTHLMAERSDAVVKVLKDTAAWVCEICEEDFHSKYGVKYIEAHHKVPLATFSSGHAIRTTDFALLCPNCHKAVHIHMKTGNLDYAEIRRMLSAGETVLRMSPKSSQ
jgi:putative restriction endonuclease